jgi:hypothetical protein
MQKVADIPDSWWNKYPNAPTEWLQHDMIHY